jgi:hypothetical protein
MGKNIFIFCKRCIVFTYGKSSAMFKGVPAQVLARPLLLPGGAGGSK